jgi:hypothetical protein
MYVIMCSATASDQSSRILIISAELSEHPLKYDGSMTQGCRKCWLTLVFNMSKTSRSMLRRLRGEEHLLLHQYLLCGNCIDTAICSYSLPFLAALSRRGSYTHIYPFVE